MTEPCTYLIPFGDSAYHQLVILAAECGITTAQAAERSVRLALRMRSLTMAMHGLVAPVPPPMEAA